ncbi:TPA: T6SS effector BTH_I2691 family protein [Pseudomonas aeruginosa]
MYRWKDTFDECSENRTLLDSVLNPNAEVTCTRTFTILPLRYGAVGGTEAQRGLLPTLPAQLRQPYKVGQLSESIYALRPLREGFLYVLIQRKGESAYKWHSQYRVSELGTLNFIEAEKPWAPPASVSIGVDGIKGLTPMLKIHDVDGIEDLRLLYSPAPLTNGGRDKYRVIEMYRNTMTSVDIAKLASAERPPMDNVLSYDEIGLVADFAAKSQPQLNELLKKQAFNSYLSPLQSVRAAMMPAEGRKEHRGAAIVLDDTLGMVQELNAWRNASSEPLDEFMKYEDGEKLTNHRKFTIAFAIENIRKLVEDEAEKNYYKEQQNYGVRYSDPEYEMSNRHMAMQSSGNYQNFRNPQHQRQVQEAAAKDRRAKSWGKYAGYINEDMRQNFLTRYRQEVDKADAAKDARAADHLLWLQSEQLLEALDVFDRNDTEQALLFEDQMGKAITGMNATAVGEALLERWREAGISRENLFWRSLAQNQDDIEDEVEKLFSAQGALAFLDPAALQDRLKKLADLYDKSHALMDSLADASTAGPPSSYLAGGAMLINTLGNSLFQSKVATLVDKPVNKVVASAVHARLGRFAQHFRLEMRGGQPLSRGTVARIDRASARSFDGALRAGKMGPMTELRIGSALVFLEIWNLYNKLTAKDKQSREYVEAVAAAVALTAAGVEVGATAVGFAERSGNAALQQGAKAFSGGLRLGAGILAGAAALVGAWYDGKDLVKNFNLGEYSIAGMYLLRASTQLGAASLSVAVGLAYAGPFLEFLLKKHGTRPVLGAAINVGARASAAMAARMAPMLRIFFGLNLAILALVLIEIYVLPNALERYLDHCSFRKNRSNGIAKTEEREIEIMQNAIGSTL